jgi:hypothetical protein
MASGTCTLNIKIDGVSVTSLNALSATSTEASTSATGANTFSAGDTIELTVSSISSAVDLSFTVQMTET